MTPHDWKARPLGEVADFVNGRGFKPHEWVEDGLPIIRIQNLNGNLDFNYFNGTYDPKIEVQNGDLLFAWSGSRGSSFGPHFWYGPKAVLNYHTWRVVVSEQVLDKMFMYFALQLLTVQIEDEAHGAAGLVHTQKNRIELYRFSFPPLREQKAIASVLSTWNQGIRQLTDLIAAKLRFKQGLMQQILTGQRRFPGFTGEWKHAEIGQYLEECSSRVSATTVLPIYTSSRAGLKPQEDYYGGKTIINDGEYGVVPIDCFVFRHMSDDGLFVFHINQTGGDIAVSKEYPVFRAINLDRHFLLAKLNHSPDFKAFALSQKSGGTRTRLYFSKLRNWKTLLPSLSEQRRIADVLNTAGREIDLLRKQLTALKQQKKGLIQKLLTGEVRVKLPKGVG